MRLRVRAALLAMLVGACPEPELCTQSGCAWEPWIHVVDDATADGRLRAGDYVFQLKSAHVTVEWACALGAGDEPDPGCDQSALMGTGELDGEPVRWHVEVTHASDGLHVELVEERGDVWGGPEEFTIVVTRDGATVVESTHAPEYEGRWPNGPECGMYCATATEPVVVHVAP